jgi:hypothetical protein
MVHLIVLILHLLGMKPEVTYDTGALIARAGIVFALLGGTLLYLRMRYEERVKRTQAELPGTSEGQERRDPSLLWKASLPVVLLLLILVSLKVAIALR